MDEIEDEAHDRELIAQTRHQTYKDILFGESENDVSYTYVFYSLSCIILSVAITSIITLVPVHNVMIEPQYWWEVLIQAIAGFVTMSCAYTLLNCSYWTNISFLLKFTYTLARPCCVAPSAKTFLSELYDSPFDPVVTFVKSNQPESYKIVS